MIKGDGEGLDGVLLLPLTVLVRRALLLPLPTPLGLLREVLGLADLRGRFPLAFALFAIEDSTDRFLAEAKLVATSNSSLALEGGFCPNSCMRSLHVVPK